MICVCYYYCPRCLARQLDQGPEGECKELEVWICKLIRVGGGRGGEYGRGRVGELWHGEGRGNEGEKVENKHGHCELKQLCSSPPFPNYFTCSSIYSLVSAALGSQIKVADRPVTQQGLGGMKTGARGRNNSHSRPLVLVHVGRA